MAFDYPVFLDVGGRHVLVVGGGPVAARKAGGLLAAGANVTTVAPTLSGEIQALATQDGSITLQERPYEAADLDGVALVITATDDPAVNAEVAADCRAARVWVNSADDPANCTFILPAITRRGRLTVAVSSGGATPALAQHVRQRVATDVLTEQVAAAAEVLAAERDAVHAAGRSTEGLDWTGRLNELLGAETHDGDG